MTIVNTRGSIGTLFLGPRWEETQTRDVDGPAAGVVPPVWSDEPNVIDPETALGISAVYRSVSVITSSVSQMPLGVYRDGIEIKTPSIIKQPNIAESQRQFVKKTTWSLATHGNAYWRVYGEYPTIQNLEVLDPNSVTVVLERGKTRYWIGGEEVRADKIRHLRLEPRPGQAKGTGPIQRGQSELLGALRLRNFADNWFGFGVPLGMLTTEQTLDAQTAAAFAEAWQSFVREHGTAVLSNGMRYEPVNIKPADAQYLEVTQAKNTAIARLFGVPTTLIASSNDGGSMTYINQQELFMQFLQTTLVDYMNEIEDAFSSLLPRGQQVEFKEEALLRMNTAAEISVQVQQIAAGLRTPNELRAADGLPPLPGGDTAGNPNLNNGSEQDNGNE